MAFTKGFIDDGEFRRHWFNHGPRLNCASNLDYLARADAFCGGPLPDDTAECLRNGRDRVRYNQTTHEFGVLTPSGIIRTYGMLTSSPTKNRVRFCENCK